jgi:multidrug efflux pump subunit AcrA (membrane-fusion protein)
MKAHFTPWLAEYSSLDGVVASCAASVDPLTALVSVTIDFTGSGGSSAPVGLNGTLLIVTESAEDAMVIPLRTVVLSEESLRVPVMVEGAVELREVTTGIRAGDSIQIVSGLGFGDAVIIEAPVSLEQGLSVIETAP